MLNNDELKKSIGYLRALADWTTLPEMGRSLNTVIEAVEMLLEVNDSLTAALLDDEKSIVEALMSENIALREELIDERDRFDRLTDFELAEARELENYRAFYGKVNALPRCETCAQRCFFRPRLGEDTRFNCPMWKGNKEDRR